jgi:antitoxin component YwqK of YwqJK toxin-antitoxin module
MNTLRLTTLVLLIVAFGNSAVTANQIAIKKKKKVVVYYPKSKQIHYEGLQVNGNKEGLWTYYTRDGYKSKTTNYLQGKKNGSHKKYIKNTIVADENFLDGVPHGTQRYYTSDGKILAHYFLNQGIPDSARFFRNGSYQFYKHENYKDNKVVEVRNFNSSGKLLSVERYRNDIKHGTWVNYSPHRDDTIPAGITNYRDNHKNGYVMESKSRDGNIQIAEGYFVNDTLEGLVVIKEDGRVVLECQYKKGKLDGAYRTYHNASLVEEIFYASGIRTGISTVYDPTTGKVVSRGYWKGSKDFNNADEPDSLFEYHPNGRIKRADWYRSNVDQYYEIHSFIEKDSSGLVLSSGQYKAGAPDGKWKEFHPNGKPKSVINYRDGLAHGHCEFRNDKGVLLLRYTANEGVVNTWPEVWDYTGKPVSNKDPEYADLVVRYNKTDVRFTKLDDLVLPTVEMIDGESAQIVEGPHIAIEGNRTPKNPEPQVNIDMQPLLPADYFPGGDTALKSWIKQELNYPVADLVFRNTAVVEINFTIDENGMVPEAEVWRCSNPKEIGLANEALRVVYSIPWQISATNKNSSPVRLTITIQF